MFVEVGFLWQRSSKWSQGTPTKPGSLEVALLVVVSGPPRPMSAGR